MDWEANSPRGRFLFLLLTVLCALLLAGAFFSLFTRGSVERPLTFQQLGKDRGAELRQVLSQFFKHEKHYYALEVKIGRQEESYIGLMRGADWYLLGYDQLGSYAIRHELDQLEATVGDRWLSFSNYEYALFTPREHLLLLLWELEALASDALFSEHGPGLQGIQLELAVQSLLPYLLAWVDDGKGLFVWEEYQLQYLLLYHPYTYELKELRLHLVPLSSDLLKEAMSLRFYFIQDVEKMGESL